MPTLTLQALNALGIEAQMNLSRIVTEERAQKDIAVQQVMAQARAELHAGKGDAVLGQSPPGQSADKVTYSMTWVQQAATPNNIEAIMAVDTSGDSDKDK